MRSNPSLVLRKNNPMRSCTSRHDPETNEKRTPSPFQSDDINEICAMMENLFITKEEQRKEYNQVSNVSIETKQRRGNDYISVKKSGNISARSKN
jgi:hypothetical protein